MDCWTWKGDHSELVHGGEPTANLVPTWRTWGYDWGYLENLTLSLCRYIVTICHFCGSRYRSTLPNTSQR